MTYIYQYNTDFTIPPENVEGARQALLPLADEEDGNLRGLLKEWDFAPADFDDEEETGITHLEYLGEKQDNEQMDQLFGLLAPFVKAESQICFYDDEGEHFRYYFAYGMVFRQEGEVIFPDVPSIIDYWSLPPEKQKDFLNQVRKESVHEE